MTTVTIEQLPPLAPVTATTVLPTDDTTEASIGIEKGMDPNEDDASKPAAAAKVVNAKRAWTEAEDELLIQTVTKIGAQSWTVIASHMTNRMGKQCRERWFNHLCPAVKKGEWTEEEDLLIDEGVAELGTKWSEIVKRLPGRTDNAIKNRYNSNQRRNQRLARRAQAEERGEVAVGGAKRAGGGAKPKRKRNKREGDEGCEDAERAEAAEGAEAMGFGAEGEMAEGAHLDGVQDAAQRKRRKILELATQLACESDEGNGRDALIRQLVDVTRSETAASHFKPFARWEMIDGGSSDRSEDTDRADGAYDLEQGVEDLLSAAASQRASRANSPNATPAAAPYDDLLEPHMANLAGDELLDELMAVDGGCLVRKADGLDPSMARGHVVDMGGLVDAMAAPLSAMDGTEMEDAPAFGFTPQSVAADDDDDWFSLRIKLV